MWHSYIALSRDPSIRHLSSNFNYGQEGSLRTGYSLSQHDKEWEFVRRVSLYWHWNILLLWISISIKWISWSIKINGRSSIRGYVKVDNVSSMPFCKVCVIGIKVDYGGKNGLNKHSITEKYTRLQKSQNTTAHVTNFFYSECWYRRGSIPFYKHMPANVPSFYNS